jgi:hypothetical protein
MKILRQRIKTCLFGLLASPITIGQPNPAILAREIVESLETAREQFRGIEDELKD